MKKITGQKQMETLEPASKDAAATNPSSVTGALEAATPQGNLRPIWNWERDDQAYAGEEARPKEKARAHKPASRTPANTFPDPRRCRRGAHAPPPWLQHLLGQGAGEENPHRLNPVAAETLGVQYTPLPAPDAAKNGDLGSSSTALTPPQPSHEEICTARPHQSNTSQRKMPSHPPKLHKTKGEEGRLVGEEAMATRKCQPLQPAAATTANNTTWTKP